MKTKTCIKCSANLKKVGFLCTKGWSCKNCKGLFVRFKYLPNKEALKKKLDKHLKNSSHSDANCLDCNQKMKLFNLGQTGLELDVCPIDYGVWFDIKESYVFVNWFNKHHPKKQIKDDGIDFDIVYKAMHFFD